MPTITVLQPDPEVPLGRFEPWLTEAGMQLELVPLWNAELPQIADGLLILGGRMNCHAEAEHPWLPGVRRLVASAVENGTPTLGICLGHQILAEALGGAVTVDHPDGREEGPQELHWSPTAGSDPMLGSLATQGSCPVAMSHRDVVTRLPPGAIELARTDRFAHQVFRAGSAVGVQFHPEASPEQVARWAELTGGDAAGDRAALTAVDTEVSAAARAVAYGFADQLGATRTTR
ncbi:type 1 glutamine amidotransferase [Enemella evansiae]|uniref:Glutamine amidotransferase n=1 Tax=Enemella evansiae TaxID=2016499 RepID=A0A255GCP1_9ACTN|nr:type 1 glutamine amidotransferase [Enemella evansiae]OYO03885.1 glutamine amidotransferase [Enemella evansiae]OYO13647.1 glutamine amidotransferase [Enemella evansiae]